MGNELAARRLPNIVKPLIGEHNFLSWRSHVIAISVFVLFTGVWYVLAGYLTAWSDELSHMATALGILLTGEPFTVSFDRCGQVVPGQYLRGVEFSWLVAASYKAFGESLRSARLVPFIFTLLTWITYVVYVKYRGSGAAARQIAIATVLFFGQSMVLEKALYVRMYAPMLFLMLLSLIALWEARSCWKGGRVWVAGAWLGVACVLVAISTFRVHQSPLLAAVFLVALVWMLRRRFLPLASFEKVWQQLLCVPQPWKYLLVIALCFALYSVSHVSTTALDVLAAKLSGVQRVHVTVWDNMFGLLRFLLVLNVVLFLWLGKQQTDNSRSNFGFDSWILSTGIISGLLIGLFMNHNFIFWSRFFYLSVGLAVLGASTRLATLADKRNIVCLMLAYVLINGVMSGVTFGFDRSNIGKAITWLRYNASEQDIILSFNAELSIHGGTDLCGRTSSILRGLYLLPTNTSDQWRRKDASSAFAWMYRDPKEARRTYITGEDLKMLLEAHPSSEVYFLYTDHYQFRDWLYRLTTGRVRTVREDMFGLLKDWDVGEQVITGLRGCGLKRLDRDKLFRALEASGL